MAATLGGDAAATFQKRSLEDLTRWSKSVVGGDTNTGGDSDVGSVFPLREDLNDKIILWEGCLAELDVDAIVNTSNEALTEMIGPGREIFYFAGKGLELEVEKLEGCKTGEAKITQGFELPAR